MRIQRWRMVASVLVGLAGMGYLAWMTGDNLHRLGPSPHGVDGDWIEGMAFGLEFVVAWVLALNIGYECLAWLWKLLRNKPKR